MTRADAGSRGGTPGWATASPAGPPATSDTDLAAIIRRADAIGIPAWRIIVALGLRLPAAPGG